MATAQLPPFDLRVIYDWMRPEAVMAARLTGATPQCWLDAAGGPIAAADLLSTTRSSGINIPNTAGVYQSLGNNELPRTDRGLYANGQFTNRTGRVNPSLDQLPVKNLLTEAEGFAGQPLSLYFAGATGVAGQNRGFHATQNLTAGEPYTASVLVKMIDGEPPVFGSSTTNNPANTFSINVGSNAIDPLLYQVQKVGSDVWKVSVSGLFTSGIQFGVFQGAFNQPGRAFNVCGLQVLSGLSPSDALVPGSSDTGGPTLLASDIRAVQGVRPSDSQPEPFPGWEAAGLDDAFGGKAIVTIDRLNAAAARFIAGAGTDADNLTKLIFDTDNRFKLIVRKSGVDEVALQTGVVASTGEKTIEWQAKPGDYGIDATGVAGDTDSDAETLPEGATTLRIGSDFGALNPFNGWIGELQILKVAA